MDVNDVQSSTGNVNSSFMHATSGEVKISPSGQDVSSATKDDTQGYNNSERLHLLKRSSSQGHGSRDQRGVYGNAASSRRSRDSRNNTAVKSFGNNGSTGAGQAMGAVSNSFGEPVSQSAAFTEFKIIQSPDQLAEL